MPERIPDSRSRAPAPARTPPATAARATHAAQLAGLHATIGNRAVGRLLSRSKTAVERDADAAALIATHTSWGWLDEDGLGQALLDLLPDRHLLMHDAFDALGSTDRDDVAWSFCNAASDERLTEIAQTKKGRDALRRVVRELLAGWSSDAENQQMRRVMAIISEQAELVDDGQGGKTIEVEVVTFDKGGAVMDWLGENVAQPVWQQVFWAEPERANQFGKGSRGHTAILVGGMAYSYEGTGWRVGQSAKEYMEEATKSRDATGQVLLLSLEDAKKIQKHLDAAANTGIYLLGGEICSDATGTALEAALGKIKKDANPQHLKQQLASSGKVAKTRKYSKGGDGSPQ